MNGSIDMTRRNTLLGVGAAALAAAMPACAQTPPPPDRVPEPVRGQAGKDVIWIPTPDEVVHRLLQLARVQPTDNVVDLGSGDGKIVIAAARDFGARARGIEFNPNLVAVSRRNAAAAGVGERAEFQQGDIFATDFTQATVVTMYLLPQLNLRLRHTLLAMKPGTRVVSHDFSMGDWEPDELSRASSRIAHLWVVPANAGGKWRLRFPLRSSTADVPMTVEQTFQKIRGNVEFSGFETTLRQPLMDGARISFAFTDAEGRLREFRGVVAPDRITGEIAGGGSFMAERVGAAPPIGGSEPVDRAQAERSNLL